MALKITIEKVDNGTPSLGSHRPVVFANITDNLPVVVIVPDTDATGVSIKTLKAFLNLAKTAQMETQESVYVVDPATLIESAHVEFVDPIVV